MTIYLVNFENNLTTLINQFETNQVRLDQIEEMPIYLEKEFSNLKQKIEQTGKSAKKSFDIELNSLEQKTLLIKTKYIKIINNIQTITVIKICKSSESLLSKLHSNKAEELSLLMHEICVLFNSPYLNDQNRFLLGESLKKLIPAKIEIQNSKMDQDSASQNCPTPSISSLPKEIIREIFPYMDKDSQLRLREVSKFFQIHAENTYCQTLFAKRHFLLKPEFAQLVTNKCFKVNLHYGKSVETTFCIPKIPQFYEDQIAFSEGKPFLIRAERKTAPELDPSHQGSITIWDIENQKCIGGLSNANFFKNDRIYKHKVLPEKGLIFINKGTSIDLLDIKYLANGELKTWKVPGLIEDKENYITQIFSYPQHEGWLIVVNHRPYSDHDDASTKIFISDYINQKIISEIQLPYGEFVLSKSGVGLFCRTNVCHSWWHLFSSDPLSIQFIQGHIETRLLNKASLRMPSYKILPDIHMFGELCEGFFLFIPGFKSVKDLGVIDVKRFLENEERVTKSIPMELGYISSNSEIKLCSSSLGFSLVVITDESSDHKKTFYFFVNHNDLKFDRIPARYVGEINASIKLDSLQEFTPGVFVGIRKDKLYLFDLTQMDGEIFSGPYYISENTKVFQEGRSYSCFKDVLKIHDFTQEGSNKENLSLRFSHKHPKLASEKFANLDKPIQDKIFDALDLLLTSEKREHSGYSQDAFYQRNGITASNEEIAESIYMMMELEGTLSTSVKKNLEIIADLYIHEIPDEASDIFLKMPRNDQEKILQTAQRYLNFSEDAFLNRNNQRVSNAQRSRAVQLQNQKSLVSKLKAIEKALKRGNKDLAQFWFGKLPSKTRSKFMHPMTPLFKSEEGLYILDDTTSLLGAYDAIDYYIQNGDRIFPLRMERELICFLKILDKNEKKSIIWHYFNKLEKATQNVIKKYEWNPHDRSSHLTDEFIKANPTDPIIKLVVQLTLERNRVKNDRSDI